MASATHCRAAAAAAAAAVTPTPPRVSVKDGDGVGGGETKEAKRRRAEKSGITSFDKQRVVAGCGGSKVLVARWRREHKSCRSARGIFCPTAARSAARAFPLVAAEAGVLLLLSLALRA